MSKLKLRLRSGDRVDLVQPDGSSSTVELTKLGRHAADITVHAPADVHVHKGSEGDSTVALPETNVRIEDIQTGGPRPRLEWEHEFACPCGSTYLKRGPEYVSCPNCRRTWTVLDVLSAKVRAVAAAHQQLEDSDD